MRTALATLVAFLIFTASASAQTVLWGYQGSPDTEHTTPFEPSGLPEPAVATKAGYHSALALEPNGELYAQGEDIGGQLGDGGGPVSLTAWVRVHFPEGVKIKAMGIALDENLAVDSMGQGWAWGRGRHDVNCGVGENVEVPMRISGLTDVVEVSGYEEHVLWRTESGHVLACGENTRGQSGQPEGVSEVATPTEVPSVSTAVEIASGSEWSLVRLNSGVVDGFGTNKHGQLCFAKKVAKYVYGAEALPFPGVVDQVAAGNGTTLALVEGVPYGCGDDGEATIGDGGGADKYAPTAATELLMKDCVHLATGAGQAACVTGGGQILTWGEELKGSLGNGVVGEGPAQIVPFDAYAGSEVSETALDVVAR